MSEEIVHASGPVALIGGGETGEGDLAAVLERSDLLVAADRGAGVALAAGHVPDAVIGDLDSLHPSDLASLPASRVHRIAEQDSTDFDKALRSIAAPLVLAAGFLGARLDHQLAVLSTLLRYPERACVLVGARELVFLAPPRLALELSAGDTVSLMPLAPVTGRSTGLEWPIDGLALAPGGRIGTSNRALGPVRLSVDGPFLLVIVPRRAIDVVTQAFAPVSRQPALPRWPARE